MWSFGFCRESDLWQSGEAVHTHFEFGADHNISALSCLTFVILTDACYELGKAGLGGVLVGPTGRFIEYFSYYLSPLKS